MRMNPTRKCGCESAQNYAGLTAKNNSWFTGFRSTFSRGFPLRFGIRHDGIRIYSVREGMSAQVGAI